MPLGYAEEEEMIPTLKEFTLSEKGRLRDWSLQCKLRDERALHRQLWDQTLRVSMTVNLAK